MEQMDLFDWLMKNPVKDQSLEMLSDPLKYLKKGERIVSLLREKNFSSKEIPFFEAVNLKKFYPLVAEEKWNVLQKIAAKVLINPVLEGIDAGSHTTSDFDDLFEAGMVHSKLEENKESTGYRMVKTSLNSGVSKYILKVFVKGIEAPFFVPCGTGKMSDSKNGRFWYFRVNKKEQVLLANGNFFAGICVYHQIRNKIREELAEDDSRVKDWLENRHEVFRKKVRMKEAPYILKKEIEILPEVSKIFGTEVRFFEDFKKAECDMENRIQAGWFLPYLFLHDISEQCVMEYASFGRKVKIALNPVFMDVDLIVSLFEDCLQPLYESDMVEERVRKELQKGYAKSYMTKANIPEKVLKAMETSKFNDYFEYVEMDEETDLLKAEELAKEFEAFAGFFGFQKRNVALRFRKLGNHKAAGLYYPGLRCLCVDIRHPDSFAHEYFHMIDYESGRLSRKAAFSAVLNKYSAIIRKEAEKPETKGILKGKYDLFYYLQPSEVFARCGEIYLMRILGFSFSMVKPCEREAFAYPQDKELLDLIAQYYDWLLNVDRRMAEGGVYD